MNQEKFLALKTTALELKKLASSELLSKQERHQLTLLFIAVQTRVRKIESAKLAGRRRQMWLEGKSRCARQGIDVLQTWVGSQTYLQYRRSYNRQEAKRNDFSRGLLLKNHSLDVARAFPKSKLPA